jgi:hypothetical protein
VNPAAAVGPDMSAQCPGPAALATTTTAVRRAAAGMEGGAPAHDHGLGVRRGLGSAEARPARRQDRCPARARPALDSKGARPAVDSKEARPAVDSKEARRARQRDHCHSTAPVRWATRSTGPSRWAKKSTAPSRRELSKSTTLNRLMKIRSTRSTRSARSTHSTHSTRSNRQGPWATAPIR